jgi:hypothetical protein
MKKTIPVIIFTLFLLVGFAFAGNAGVRTDPKSFAAISASTPSPIAYLPAVFYPPPTPTPTPTWTPTPTPIFTSTPIPAAYFSVANGFSDVIPHQIIRTSADRLFIFAPRPYSTTINVYSAGGLPSSSSNFSLAAQISAPFAPISLETVYDGMNIIHVLIHALNGEIKDYPFNSNTNQFNSPITLATNGGTLNGNYIGTSGISGMIDLTGNLQIVYWTRTNHITHLGYTYDSTSNVLTPIGEAIQVDSAGSANHPVVRVSPFDNSLTISWVSQATNPAKILARICTSAGVWGSIQTVSTSPVWTSTSEGINIDQGPSLLIGSDGNIHLTYIENYDASNNYGRIHYVTSDGFTWVDQALNAYSHNPALAINSQGELYIIGHGHPLNAVCQSMSDMCTIKKSSNGSWGTPQLFAPHPATSVTFDSSVSVKWSVVGFNRPELVEFVFFATPYSNPMMYYGRFSTR